MWIALLHVLLVVMVVMITMKMVMLEVDGILTVAVMDCISENIAEIFV